MENIKTKNADEMFCSSCGEIIKKEAEICPKCGVRQKRQSSDLSNAEGKDWLTSILLCFFLGVLGIHRFYTGYTGMGILIILTIGGFFGIIPLIDLVRMLTGSYKDSEGNALVRR